MNNHSEHQNRSAFSILFRLIGLVGPLTGWMILAVMLGVLGFLAAIAIPLLGTYGLLEALNLAGGLSLGLIFGLLALCALLRGVLRYGEQSCNHYIAFRLLARIRDLVFGKLRKLAPAKLETKDKGSLISMITSDVELLEVFYAHTISPICIALIVSAVFIITAGVMIHPLVAALLALSYVWIGVILPLIFSKKSTQVGLDYRTSAGKLNSFVLESLRGLQVILQFGDEKKRLHQLNEKTDALIHKEEELKHLTAMSTGISQVSISLFSLLMVVVCGALYAQGQLSPAQAIMACLIQFSTFGPVIALSNLGTGLAQTLGAGSRVLDLLDEPVVMEEVTDGVCVNALPTEVESIGFTYPDGEKVLENFSLELEPGSLTGLQGPSGCGKSTFLKLLMRFWDPQTGKIEMSSEDLKKINTSCLRANESYLSQDAVLFDDTIENNLRIANPEASMEDIRQACKKASIDELIESLPDGYQTQVGELGGRLSGGERQRLGLARAFLHKGQLLLLDEPTSNLDSLNEGMILKAIQDEHGDQTVVIVSHRPGSLKFADRIIKMEDHHGYSGQA